MQLSRENSWNGFINEAFLHTEEGKEVFGNHIQSFQRHEHQIPKALDGGELLQGCKWRRKDQSKIPTAIKKAMYFSSRWGPNTRRNIFTVVHGQDIEDIDGHFRWLVECDQELSMRHKDINLRKAVCIDIHRQKLSQGDFGKVYEIIFTIWRRTLVVIVPKESTAKAALIRATQRHLEGYKFICVDAHKTCTSLASVGFPVQLIMINNIIGYVFPAAIKKDLEVFIKRECPRAFEGIPISVLYLPSFRDTTNHGSSIDYHKTFEANWYAFLYYVFACSSHPITSNSVMTSAQVPGSTSQGKQGTNNPSWDTTGSGYGQERHVWTRVRTGFFDSPIASLDVHNALVNSRVYPSLQEKEPQLECAVDLAKLVRESIAVKDSDSQPTDVSMEPQEENTQPLDVVMEPQHEDTRSEEGTQLKNKQQEGTQPEDISMEPQSDDKKETAGTFMMTGWDDEGQDTCRANCYETEQSIPPGDTTKQGEITSSECKHQHLLVSSRFNKEKAIWLLKIPVYANSTIIFDGTRDELVTFKVILRQKAADGQVWIGDLGMTLEKTEKDAICLGFQHDYGEQTPFELGHGKTEIVSIEEVHRESPTKLDKRLERILCSVNSVSDTGELSRIPLASMFCPTAFSRINVQREREMDQLRKAIEQCQTLSLDNDRFAAIRQHDSYERLTDTQKQAFDVTLSGLRPDAGRLCTSNSWSQAVNRHFLRGVIGPPGTGKSEVFATAGLAFERIYIDDSKEAMYILTEQNIALISIALKLQKLGCKSFVIIEGYHESMRHTNSYGDIAEESRVQFKDCDEVDKMKPIVLCTIGVFVTLKAKVMEAFKPVIVMMDEGSRITTLGAMAVLQQCAHYSTTPGMFRESSLVRLVFFGDNKQLRPYMADYDKNIKSVIDASYSFAEMKDMRECFRLPRLITDIISSARYENRLRPSKEAEMLGKQDTVRVILCEPCLINDSHKGSVANMSHTFVAASLYIWLRGKGFRELDIAILSPYIHQSKRIRDKIRDTPQYREDSLINVTSIDAWQGKEAKMVILAMTRDDPNKFVMDDLRQTVALTRSSGCTFIITSKLALAKYEKEDSMIWRFVDQYRQNFECFFQEKDFRNLDPRIAPTWTKDMPLTPTN